MIQEMAYSQDIWYVCVCVARERLTDSTKHYLTKAQDRENKNGGKDSWKTLQNQGESILNLEGSAIQI